MEENLRLLFMSVWDRDIQNFSNRKLQTMEDVCEEFAKQAAHYFNNAPSAKNEEVAKPQTQIPNHRIGYEWL